MYSEYLNIDCIKFKFLFINKPAKLTFYYSDYKFDKIAFSVRVCPTRSYPQLLQKLTTKIFVVLYSLRSCLLMILHFFK